MTSSPKRGGATARQVALRVIRRVTEEGAYSNLTLAAELALSRIDERDRRFAADLAYGTLRRLLVLDDAIARSADRPLRRIDPQTLGALRIGAYQLLYTRVPAHAAVSESVSLAPARSRGFVNAVLRRVAVPSSLSTEVPDEDDDEAIAKRTGLASWAVGELRRVLPGDEIEPAAAALATAAPLTLRASRARKAPEALAAALRRAGLDVTPGRHHPDVLDVPSATPASLPGYREGWFAIQDEASVLVGAAIGARPGERILDACAGPGGKAAHLAVLVGSGPGGVLVAADAATARVRLVLGTARRLGVRVEVLAQDARHPALRQGWFDAALVDAPCSGLGAARRRPELLWRPSSEHLPGLASLQASILSGVADLIRPGGRIVYSVCTFPVVETDEVVGAFLASRPDFGPYDVPGPDGPAPIQRLWPHRHGTDAMFYAGFTRRGDPS